MKKLLIPLFALSTLAAAGQTEGKNQTDHVRFQPEFGITLWGELEDGTYKSRGLELWFVLALPFEKWEFELEGWFTKELGNDDPYGREEEQMVPHVDLTWLIKLWDSWKFQAWLTARFEQGDSELLKQEFEYFTLPKWLKVELWTILRCKTQNGFAFYIVWAFGNFVTNEWDSDFSGTARAWVVQYF